MSEREQIGSFDDKDAECHVCHDKGGPGPLDPCPECNRYGPLPESSDDKDASADG